MNRTVAVVGTMVLGIVLLTSCADLGYYRQAVGGQWALWRAQQSLEALLADSATPEPLRERLAKAESMRRFASEVLALPDNDSYRSYADLERPYVVRNLFAAPPLSLEPHRWCYPVVGCVIYRGYFDPAAAEQAAAAMKAQGFDVFLGPVPAYSTLGWFDDPLLNTFIHWSDGQLAELMFHELTHQQLYLAGDADFSESLATFVGQWGAEQWLLTQGDAAEEERYQRRRRYREDFLSLVLDTKAALTALYAGSGSEVEKLAGKEKIFAELQQRYHTVKTTRWDGFAGYDRWFAELNNAKFVAVGAYHRWVAAFARLHAEADGDIAVFFSMVADLAERPEAERDARLQALSAAQSRP